MKTIPKLHDFIGKLPDSIREELEGLCSVRHLGAGQSVYRLGDESIELYQLLRGSVRMCNYTHEGKEVVSTNFRPGDCFGEVGLIDGLPRLSHAIADETSTVRVLSKKHFDYFYQNYLEVSQQLNLMLCRRVRILYGMAEEAGGLNLQQRLARLIHRLAYSHGNRDDDQTVSISTSQEELGRMLGVSRQSISKELKRLVAEGCMEICYGKIHIRALDSLKGKCDGLIGMEQLTAIYDE